MSLTPAGALEDSGEMKRDIHTVAILAFEEVQSLDVSGPAEVLSSANDVLPDGVGYDVTIVSRQGGQVTSQSAVDVNTVALGDLASGPVDTVMIAGGRGVQHVILDPDALADIGEFISRAKRLVTVCSGALLAAATGALDGHRVTTHWTRAAMLATSWPAVQVDADPIYLCSEIPGRRPVWSSAGVTAGIDLTLALVERDHSTDIAQAVARELVMFLRRPGGQSQFAAPTWIRQAPVGPIQRAQDLVCADPGADHSVRQLALRVGMSERHFVRTFSRDVGLSPARFVARVRVDAARQALESSADTVEVIARRCGFGTAETMRRTLARHIGVSPDAYRQRFHRPANSAL